MDFHMLERIVNMLNFVSPQDVMIELVNEDDDMTPERAHVIICAAMLVHDTRA